MGGLKDEWNEYKSIIHNYEKIDYTTIHKVKIPRIKERCGGCCYYEGKVLGIPNSAREVVVVDPPLESVSFMGTAPIGTFKWTGGCKFGGKCYGFPRKENSILTIDLMNGIIKKQNLDLCYRGEHHYSGVVTPEGIVYQPPRNTDHLLCIDINTFHTWQIHMPSINGTCRYSSAVLHPNGDIFLIPERGYRFAVIHQNSGDIEYFAENPDHSVFGAIIGWDGNIYGFSKNGNGILKISVKEKKVDYVCQNIGNPDCYGSVVGVNGKIYGVPGGGDIIWEFDIGKVETKPLFRLNEQGYAKCAGGGVGNDGTIVMMPCFGEYVYFLKTEIPVLGEFGNRFINYCY